jgi:hypothetical protein
MMAALQRSFNAHQFNLFKFILKNETAHKFLELNHMLPMLFLQRQACNHKFLQTLLKGLRNMNLNKKKVTPPPNTLKQPTPTANFTAICSVGVGMKR